MVDKELRLPINQFDQYMECRQIGAHLDKERSTLVDFLSGIYNTLLRILLKLSGETPLALILMLDRPLLRIFQLCYTCMYDMKLKLQTLISVCIYMFCKDSELLDTIKIY